MIDVKTLLRTKLIGTGAVIALVPAARIFVDWPTSFTTLPAISYKELNNFVDDIDYYDDFYRSETSQIQIDIWCKPNTSTTSIAQAVDTCLNGDLWNRDYAEDFVEPDTKIIHKVMRYNKRHFITI